jgi:hypothetical protein
LIYTKSLKIPKRWSEYKNLKKGHTANYKMTNNRHQYINLCHVKYCVLFSECTSGTYGVNCEHRCDKCVGKICEPRDGNCTYGCIEGFTGVSCNLSGINQENKKLF